MKTRIVLALLVGILLALMVAEVVSAGGPTYYTCRSGLKNGNPGPYLCTYRNRYGAVRTAWNGYAIATGLGATPVGGRWVAR